MLECDDLRRPSAFVHGDDLPGSSELESRVPVFAVVFTNRLGPIIVSYNDLNQRPSSP